MTNPKLKDAKRSLAAAAMSAGTIFTNANPAHAIQGTLSYSQFMEQINQKLIVAVNVDETGRAANYLATDGGKGGVQLIPDPDLIPFLQKAGVDLSIARAAAPDGFT